MKKIFLCIALFASVFAHAQNYWQQEVNYSIDVSLNDVEHSLTGFINISYINHSPDTIYFIWFHVWPNAYKNDQTAFSDQLLENKRSDFYFSDQEQKGYINRLDFRVDGNIIEIDDHPQFIDIVKIILPMPLASGDSVHITTPFYEKLPFNFSRGGHVKQSYQITQWYPKPVVYDREGWHPIPYLDQGEFYSEFGNYDVRINIPKNYVVAATGELLDEEEKKWIESRTQETVQKKPSIPTQKKQFINKKKITKKKSTSIPVTSILDTATKTLHYSQNHIHDFAWFADKSFIVNHDTTQLGSGKIIQVYSFYSPEALNTWKNSIAYTKDAIHFRSNAIGDYPYSIMSVVEAKTGTPGGMEYPTITSISPTYDERDLDLLINHETGHNWFYGALASNERRYPWMDEGMNTYYDQLYEAWKYGNSIHSNGWWKKKLPDDWNKWSISILEKEKTDQPISTSSEKFTETNYNLIVYDKTAEWLLQLKNSLGVLLFDSCMHNYFSQWQFRHPYPRDFQSTFESTSKRSLSNFFAILDRKGPLTNSPARKIKPTFLFSLKNTDKFNYINIGPSAGFNMYDKFMIGAIVHNHNLPSSNLEFALIPMYATQSKQLKGLGDIKYSWRPDSHIQKIIVGVSAAGFSTNAAIDTNSKKIFESFSKVVPYIRVDFSNKSARSSVEKWIDFRSFIVHEKQFDKYYFSEIDSTLHPTAMKSNNRYINQLSFNIADNRILYPYNVQLQLQQSDAFYRINLTGNYFFNYDNDGGMNVRFFAAKFGYWNHNSSGDLSRYQPKLLGVTGEEDYTYSNYFLGRSASYAIEDASVKNGGLAAQQIMIRDGGLKLRIDQYDFLQGRSENWVTALNFNSTLPNHLLPVKLPIRLFFDVGTYSEAWKTNSLTSRFLYVGGVQLSLLKNILNIYIPIIYSSDFRDQLKTIPAQNTFWKRITFSIDIQNFNSKKFTRHISFRNEP